MPPEQSASKLHQAPIIEAVVDFTCDLPPSLHRGTFHSSAQKAFDENYPEFLTTMIHEQEFAVNAGKPTTLPSRQIVRGYQSISRDKKQLVQARFDGFSFHRLRPYTTLDDYLPEIKRCWEIYVQFAQVVIVKKIALRFINRIELPLTNGGVNIETYLRNGPTLSKAPGSQMRLTGFMHQHQVIDLASKNEATIILAARPPEATVLPIVLDIDVLRAVRLAPSEWNSFLPVMDSLRSLKNVIFRDTLTSECLNSYQQPLP